MEVINMICSGTATGMIYDPHHLAPWVSVVLYIAASDILS